MNANPVSAGILDIAMHGNVDLLLKQLKPNQIQELLDLANNPSFGKEGDYTFLCKKCGGYWKFQDKETMKLFTKFHKTYGCDLEPYAYTKEKKNITGIVYKRTGAIISDLGIKYMEELVNPTNPDDINKNVEVKNEDPETDVPGEPTS